MKNIVKNIIVIIGIVGLFSPFFVAKHYNNFRLHKFAKQLSNIELPQDIDAIETKEICGNLNGNGNSMDFLACLLVKTSRSKTELEDFLDSIEFDPVGSGEKNYVTKEVVETNGAILQSKYLERQTIEFDSLTSETDFRNYYIIVIYDGGYSAAFDTRGH